MRKCANISPYMRKPLLIYDFATAPFWISFYMGKFYFLFLSVYASFSSLCSPTFCIHRHTCRRGGRGTRSSRPPVLSRQKYQYLIYYEISTSIHHQRLRPLTIRTIRSVLFLGNSAKLGKKTKTYEYVLWSELIRTIRYMKKIATGKLILETTTFRNLF